MKLIRIKAFPDAKKEYVEQDGSGRLRVFVREPAQNNQANKAVIKVVSKFCNIPENKLRMISGHRGQNKIIQILE